MTAYVLQTPEPTVAPTPLIVEVPHAGLEVPDELTEDYSVHRDAMMRDADIYVDRLCADAPRHGATLLAATLSRYIVDLNRAPDDVDAIAVADHPSPVRLQPRGVVWRTTTDGRPMLRRPLTYDEFRQRLARYYTPYHTVLQQQLAQAHAEFGFAMVLAAHSMPSSGRTLHADPGVRRADVVPGTLGRTSADARVIDLVDAHFRQAGLSVRHDDPYRGGFTTGHYGQPAHRQHVVQIELNRALYVNEATLEMRQPEFTALRGLMGQLVAKVGALRL